MKIYISIPMTGQDPDAVEASINFAAGVIESKGHTAIDPTAIASIDDSYEAHIGADITVLLRCDAILLMEGWSCSKGCRLEAEAASIYGKVQYTSLSQIQQNTRTEEV